METCITCDKPLANERLVLRFQMLRLAFCEACSMGERVTKILAGLVERRLRGAP